MEALGARQALPGKPAPQHGETATARVVGSGAEGQQRPHAPLEARGEYTPGAFPVLLGAVSRPCGLPFSLGHNLRNPSAWPGVALDAADLLPRSEIRPAFSSGVAGVHSLSPWLDAWA